MYIYIYIYILFPVLGNKSKLHFLTPGVTAVGF